MEAKDLKQDKRNYRKHSGRNKELIRKSVDECGLGRSVLVDADGVLIAGNGVHSVIDPDTPVRVVETDGSELVVVKRTDLREGDERRRKLALADNATADRVEWDFDSLSLDFDDNFLEGWDIDLSEPEYPQDGQMQEKEIAEMERKFKERMEAGEDLTGDEEYMEFLDKFKHKNTTDDCYTPELVYDAVCRWVENEYQVSKSKFVRPFYPGGDYKNEKYPKGCIVVDNPPFSILAEILSFYKEKGIRFFLFAPSLTLFSSSSSCTALCTGVTLTYANGANVATSFLTNLEDASVRFKSSPSLYKAVESANNENLKIGKREIPKYSYPDNVITSSFMSRIAKYGIELSVSVSQSVPISCLESQREAKKTIYGKGYLVSEKAAAEKAAAEKAAAVRWKLSEKEMATIRRLSENDTRSAAASSGGGWRNPREETIREG